MCKSATEGGTRCPAHTRDPYMNSYGAVLNAPNPTMDQIRALERTAADYGSTPEGEDRIKADITAAEIRGQFENAAILRTALQRGLTNRAVGAEVARAARRPQPATPSATPVSPTRGGGAGIQWSATEPIWPKRETMDTYIAPIRTQLVFPDMARLAYRALYRKAWEAKFKRNGRAVSPSSNDEGWRWRREATEEAGEKLKASKPTKVSTLKPGMVVFNGIAIRKVLDVTVAERVASARDGEAQKIKMLVVQYSDGYVDNQVAGDNIFLRFPDMENKAPQGSQPG